MSVADEWTAGREAVAPVAETVDLLVLGAGPAGMAAATEARAHGMRVLVLDENGAPGGQVHRAVEARLAKGAVSDGQDKDGAKLAATTQVDGRTVWWPVAAGIEVFKRHADTSSHA